MTLFKWTFQLFAFLMELAMLVAIGYWAFHEGKSTFGKYALAFILILITIGIWSLWMAPTSKTRLETNYRIIAESLLFLTAAYMIYKTEHSVLALAFTLCVIVREVIAYVFKW